MSHPENIAFLEGAYARAQQAVESNDADELFTVYLELEENGFSKEAEELRKEFGVLSE